MKKVIRPIVSFGLLALLLWLIPWDVLRNGLERLSPITWIGVLVGFLAGHVIGVGKWRLLVNGGRALLKPIDAVRCYTAGLFTNICLPSIIGGDVLRMALASKATGRPEAALLGGLADRLSDTLALVLLVGVGAALAHVLLPGWGKQVLMTGALVGVAFGGLVLLLLLRRPLKKWPRKLRRPGGRALVALRRLARQPSLALSALLLSLLIQSSFVLLNAWMAAQVGAHVPLAAWFLAWPLSKLVALVPISLGGLGVREATLAGLLVPFGVAPALGILVGLLWQTVLITGGLVSGLIWWRLSRAPLMPHLRRRPVLS